jgi:hypothetical protein
MDGARILGEGKGAHEVVVQPQMGAGSLDRCRRQVIHHGACARVGGARIVGRLLRTRRQND